MAWCLSESELEYEWNWTAHTDLEAPKNIQKLKTGAYPKTLSKFCASLREFFQWFLHFYDPNE